MFLSNLRQSKFITKIRNQIPHYIINVVRHYPTALGAAIYYGFPAKKLTLIGVTGSNGKTTTVTGIHHLLQLANFKTGMISTIKAKIKNQEINTGFHVTSPDPLLLQKTLKQMTDKKLTHAVLEATSHGLVQHRFLHTSFQIGIITNITHEHLDYHKTYQKYWQAKAKIFNKVKTAILNHDDRSYPHLIKYLKQKNPNATTITYSTKTKSADVLATNIKQNSKGITFRVQIKFPNYPKTLAIKTPLIGNFNVENVLAVIATGITLKIKPTIIQKAIATYPNIPGRLEIIPHKNKTIVIDFAHTPDAMKKILQTLKKLQTNTSLSKHQKQPKIIAVFGCAGLRDKTKRPMMGKISAKLANISILTAEDPRTEDPNQIIEEIAQGCTEAKATEISIKTIHKITSPNNKTKLNSIFLRIPDRQVAITTALKISQPNDIVAILGKGHEQSMCYGTTEHPWSDQSAVQQALKT